jgi:hypothetical protein
LTTPCPTRTPTSSVYGGRSTGNTLPHDSTMSCSLGP